MWQRLIEQVDRLLLRAQEEDRRLPVAVLRFVRLLLLIWRQLVVDDALKTAQSLAYTTILSMVPALAVVFAIFKAFVGSEDLTAKVSGWLLGTLFAESVGEVTGVLQGFLGRADIGAVGAVGFIFLIVTAVNTFMSVEGAFNRIWRLQPTRPLHWRLTSYYAVLTLAPALLALAFLVSGWLEARVGASVSVGFASLLVGAGLETLALTLMYKLLPHGHVHWRAAAIGGLSAGIGFEISRALFNLYVSSIYTGSVPSRIYGSFALIPVFFLWIYLLWVIILFGVELAYLVQNRNQLTAAVLTRRGLRRGLAPAAPTGYLLSRVLVEVARRFMEGQGPVDPVVVTQHLQLEPDEVQPAVRALVEAGLLLNVEQGRGSGLVPGRPLNQVTLNQIYALGEQEGYRAGQLPDSRGARQAELTLQRALAARAAVLDVTVESLLVAPGEAENDVLSSEEAGKTNGEAQKNGGRSAKKGAPRDVAP